MTGLYGRGGVRAQARTPRARSVRRSLAELGTAAVALTVVGVLLLRPPPSASAHEHQVVPPAAVAPVVSEKAQLNRCTKGKVALTFDDGPGPFTPAVLAVLRAYKAPSTFFVLGQKVAAGRATLSAMVADGNTVGNHSWDHPHLGDLGEAEIRRQLTDTEAAITGAGIPAPVLMRPPFGSTSPVVEDTASALNLRLSNWTYDSEDWRGRRAPDLVTAVVRDATPGMVVLMHDGTADASNTVAALPGIIEGLRGRGFCTVALA